MSTAQELNSVNDHPIIHVDEVVTDADVPPSQV